MPGRWRFSGKFVAAAERSRFDQSVNLVDLTTPVANDPSPGSLRDTFAQAVSGDSIDLAQVACSLITLTSGAIEVPQGDLTIKY